MEILFLSGIDGFCHRYAVLHRAHHLRLRGIASTIRHFTDPRALDDVVRAGAVFLYRVPLSPLAAEVVRRARRAHRLVLGAVDDLIFVPDGSALPPLDHLPHAERLLWLDGVARYRAMLERCDGFVAATEPLLEEARAIGWPAFLHRDAAARVELALAARAHERRCRQRQRSGGERVRLAYFSGTPTHDADFAEIADVVAELLRLRPEVDLLVTGPLALDGKRRGIADRIQRRPLVPWPELPEAIAGADINLAPLAWRSRFSAAKGEGKYIEASAVGIPTVASPTPAFRNAIRDRENGRLAADPEAWLAALLELVDDAERREAMGAAAFADVRARFSPEVRADELVQILAEASPGRVAGAHGRDPGEAAIAWRPGEHLGRVALEPDACPDLDAPPGDLVSPPLAAGAVLEQEFTAGRDGLCRVDLRTVTHGQTLAHHLAILIERADGRVATLHHEEARHAPDRAWFAIELPTEVASAGRRYRIVLRAAGTGSGNALRFALAPPSAGPGEQPPARLDGRPLGAALALRTFARWDAELTAGGLAPVRARRVEHAASAGVR